MSSPGHASLIFGREVRDHARSSGSFGAGIAVSPGAIAETVVSEGSGGTAVRVVGCDGVDYGEARTTERAIELLRKRKGIEGGVSCTIRLSLPLGCGFGMSAAGTLAAAMGVCYAAGIDPAAGVECAHEAEMDMHTGLGDVSGIMTGGFSIRRRGGLPPYSEAKQLEIEGRVLLAVVGPPVETEKVITGSEMERITRAAKRCMAGRHDWRGVVAAARAFSAESGLITEEVRNALAICPEESSAMVMLGNSIVVLNPDERLFSTMGRVGTVFSASIDREGPLLLEMGGSFT